MNTANVVVAGVIGAAREGFLDATAGSVDGGGTKDERRPRSGGDTLFIFETGAGAVGKRVDRGRCVDLSGGPIHGGGGQINHPRRRGAEGVDRIDGSGGWDGMKDENSGAQVRSEIVESDDVRAKLRSE